MLQIQMYTDQPVKAARVIMGNNQALPAATHAEGPSAYNVELPVAVRSRTWLPCWDCTDY